MKTFIIVASLIALSSAMSGKLQKNECIMRLQDPLMSEGNCFKLNVKGCGDLVLRRVSDDKVIWSAGASGQGGQKACMQEDGNLAVLNNDGAAIWTTGTNNGVTAHLKDNGQLVVMNNNGEEVWSTDKTDSCN